MEIKKVSIKEIIPYEKNPRKNDRAVEVVEKSIKEFGFLVPVVIDQNKEIIAGHTRFKAAKKIGLKEIPCIYANDLNKGQIKAFRIMDNKAGEFAEWDLELLKQELYDLEESEAFDFTGFSKSEITKIWDSDKEVHEDKIHVDAYERAKSKTKIKKGNLFQLGNHRLMCGDSTMKGDVDKLMTGKKNILMVTDPPYGVKYDPSWRKDYRGETKTQNYGKVNNDDVIDWSRTYELFDANVIYNWHASWHTSKVQTSLEKAGYKILYSIIWIKSNFALGRGDYHWKHEPCWYAVKIGENHNWQGSRKEVTVWEINSNDMTNPEREETWGHSTQKPVECMSKPILNNSCEGENICDPFGGTGTTLIACEQLKRNCFMMEIDPVYCQVIIDRWEKLTKKKSIKIE